LKTTIHAEQWEASNKLNQLDLEESVLLQAAQAGLSAWAECTENHPPSSPGYFAWAETVRTLRELLFPLGWKRLNEGNLPLAVNEAGDLAISVQTGNDNTGRKDAQPRTSSVKGPRTAGVIQTNLQALLFPDMALPSKESLDVPGRTTWILLIHRDLKTTELRCELSRPISMSEDGHVDSWAERIILTATPFDSNPMSGIDGNPSGGSTPEITVAIKKLH